MKKMIKIIFLVPLLIMELKKDFLYPNDKPDSALDFDELNNETFLIACIYQKNKPKIYAVGSFQNEQAGKIVCRLMNEPFYEHE